MTDEAAFPTSRAAAGGLVIGGVLSVQLGAALATTLFGELGAGGAVLLRTTFAAAVLLAVWRPSPSRHRSALPLVVLLGIAFAGMNASFYAALERIPLGIAVTFEFVGPL